jgi:hypothetical protein
VPTFCRHGRFIERCPVCSPRSSGSRGRAATASPVAPRARPASPAARPAARDGLKIRRETRSSDDGFRCPLVPGLRSASDAERLVEEIGFASARLTGLAAAPPGSYADVASLPDLEQASWLAFLIAYLSPLPGEDPFAGVRLAVTDWHSGELPDLDGVPLGPHTSHDPARGTLTLSAYRHWARRSGSQALALRGDADWSSERRFERIFERLSLPGFGRTGRYDLLVTLGRVGRYDMRPADLQLVGDDATTLAAKRVFAIGDRFNLERRAKALAERGGFPLEALDLALANWAAPERATLGLAPAATDGGAVAGARSALGL